ncbi:MAG TPA: DUF1232 domain-containing protein [Trueperaceae bacterium]|nr:DUF1232 domain-containing protein [Trueperaceae bacterium]
MSMLSADKIKEMLTSTDLKKIVSDSETQEKIKAGFGKSFDMVKEQLGDNWQDVKSIYEMSFDSMFDLKTEVKYVSLAALAYLISPYDLLPESKLGALGLVDDVAVLLFAMNYAKPEIIRYAEFKNEQQKELDALAQLKPSDDEAMA